MFDQLPPELLITIFGYVSQSDRRALRQTCTRFYHASLAYSLIENEAIQIDSRMVKSEGKAILKTLLESQRKIHHITAYKVNHYDFFCVFHKFAKTIKTIVLYKCTVNFCQFTHILNDLRVLESLKLISCDTLLIEGKIFMPIDNKNLCKLKELEITDTMYLTDDTLSKFIMLFPSIDHLSVECTTLNVHEGTFKFNYANNAAIFSNPSKNVLTINYISAIVHAMRDTVRSLNFADTLINNVTLIKLLKIAELNLNRLNLNFCRELRNSSEMLIGNWHSSLTELQLANCDFVTDEFLLHICKTMLELRLLNISHNEIFTDVGFRQIENLAKLCDLDISNCENLTGKAMYEVLCSKNLTSSIKVLKINKTGIADEELGYILYTLKLTELEASFCNQLSDEFLDVLFGTQKYTLKRLDIAALNISDMGITGLGETRLRLPRIRSRYERMSISHNFVQEEIVNISEFNYNYILTHHITPNYSLKDLRNLQYLSLSRCRSLTDYFFTNALNLINLKELNMSGLLQITTKSIFFLVYNCPALEILDLTGTRIDDIGVCVLVRKLERLKHLILKDCFNITNATLGLIVQHCKVLQKLNVQGCSNLSDYLINTIANLPNIIEVIGTPNARYFMEGRIPQAPPMNQY